MLLNLWSGMCLSKPLPNRSIGNTQLAGEFERRDEVLFHARQSIGCDAGNSVTWAAAPTAVDQLMGSTARYVRGEVKEELHGRGAWWGGSGAGSS